MKKIIALSMGLLLAGIVMAQDNDDTPRMWLGGEVTFGSLSDYDVTIGPNWGIMLGERIGIGAVVSFSIGENQYSGNPSYSFGFDPYFRFYIPVVDQFSFYGDAFLGVGLGDSNTDADNWGIHSDFSVGARIGMQYWFTPRWSIAASTNIFEFITYVNEVEEEAADLDVGIGVNLNTVDFSFFWHF